MPRITVLSHADTIIKYSGLYDFAGLYRMVANWIMNREYYFEENRYKDKTFSPLGNEIQIEVNAWRKMTEYIKYWLYVKYHLWDAGEKEVVVDGIKKKLMGGRILITIQAEMEYDWMGRFKGSKFNEFLGNLYFKLNKREIESIWGDGLVYKAMELHQEIKKFLNMEAESDVYKARL